MQQRFDTRLFTGKQEGCQEHHIRFYSDKGIALAIVHTIGGTVHYGIALEVPQQRRQIGTPRKLLKPNARAQQLQSCKIGCRPYPRDYLQASFPYTLADVRAQKARRTSNQDATRHF
jgi:hypothetical protein